MLSYADSNSCLAQVADILKNTTKELGRMFKDPIKKKVLDNRRCDSQLWLYSNFFFNKT